MTQAFRLDTVARDGSSQSFDAEADHDASAGVWTYRAFVAECADFYEARFKQVAAGYIQPDMLDRHHDAFRGKGITEAIFLRVVQDAGLPLVSSTNRGTMNFENEYRTGDAERIWRRLFAEERASYDGKEDRFRFHPEGTFKGVFGRKDANRRPQFYVKGSYVLDRIFGTDHANDIDICWLDVRGKPEDQRVREWCDLCGFPRKTVQPIKIADFFACDGGGSPIFNIDLWRLEMDGCAYEMDPSTHAAKRITNLPQSSLELLPNPGPFALSPSPELNAVLSKALMKMQRHPSLYNQSTEQEIKRLMARPIP
ncbi:hypothetical protein [Sorangium cellulosum]|uniref:Uncharacterized protein n=1 Tax=Sorangium cellulosum So0157-2 TaxID=1254432 RepID=S4Y9L6_SORCE|nr:hypothetical protein [Sorangium cellulosum]AGP39483.1 hypothetical protein SCE1572_36350 [Sorangium cellulosum So0157-2]